MAARDWLQISGKLGGAAFLAAYCTMMLLQPALLLYYLAFMTASAAAAHLMTRRAGRIDVGWARGRPLARFRLRTPFVRREADGAQFHDIRVHWLPADVEVDGAVEPRITLLAASVLLVLGLFLSVLSFQRGGWPDLSASGGQSPPSGAAEPFEQRRPTAKILEITPGSPADRAGLRYGDLVVAAGGTDWPTPLTLVRLRRSSERVTLRIDRLGRTTQIALTRARLRGWRRSGFGIVVVPALAFEDHVVVTAVQYRGAAYRYGIRPGDEITVLPPSSYLSRMLLHEGPQHGSYRTLVARRPSHATVATVPATRLDNGWMDSIEVLDLHRDYRPSLGENLRFSLVAFASRVMMTGMAGARTEIRPFLALQIAAPGPGARLLRMALVFTSFFSFLFILGALAEKTLKISSLNLVVFYFTVTFGSHWAGFDGIDSGLLKLAESLPFGELLFSWTL